MRKAVTDRPAADMRAEALVASYERTGYRRVAPAILQPADPFLDLSGEDIRKRMYLTTDPSGRELCLRPDLTIPVSCDYLSLVGVKQVMKTLKDIDQHLGHTVRVAGVVPTFFDARTKLAREAVETLGGYFKERLYEPIRRSTRLAEAPSHRQTIFEYAPESQGAEDYRRLVDRFVATAQPQERAA